MTLGKRKPLVTQIVEASEEEPEQIDIKPYEGNFDLTVSTGSTQLDLAISGTKRREGGIPAGIILEIFGPPSIGKTAVLSEIAGSVQKRGGEVRFLDPETRMDKEHARIYGVSLDKSSYFMPRTVDLVFDAIETFKPKSTDVINAVCTDSLAALTTQLELEGKDGMGMGRGKAFSSGLRVVSGLIKRNNMIIPCSNQLRYGDKGEFTPGGMGIPFYASLRIKLFPVKGHKLIKTKEFKKKESSKEGDLIGEFEVPIGTKVGFQVVKSSVDMPDRKGYFYIIHRYGIDDIRGNLQFNKEVTGATRYDCCGNNKRYQAMDRALDYVEKHSLEEPVRQRTIELWHKLQEALKIDRKPKYRI
jgi:RecA/RadA recombinase